MSWRDYQRALIQIDTGRRQIEHEPSRAWLATMAVVSFAAAALILALAL